VRVVPFPSEQFVLNPRMLTLHVPSYQRTESKHWHVVSLYAEEIKGKTGVCPVGWQVGQFLGVTGVCPVGLQVGQFLVVTGVCPVCWQVGQFLGVIWSKVNISIRTKNRFRNVFILFFIYISIIIIYIYIIFNTQEHNHDNTLSRYVIQQSNLLTK
jgi:hypothetical protein